MLDLAGLEYITTSEAVWLQKFLREHNQGFAQLEQNVRNEVVREMLEPYATHWLFVPWKSLTVYGLIVLFLGIVASALSVLLLHVVIFPFDFAALIFLGMFHFSYILAMKLRKIAESERAKELIEQKEP
jgi:hypothetical protein